MLDAPSKLLDLVSKKVKMVVGYEETRHPHVPSILKHTEDFVVVQGTQGHIGVTLGAPGIQIAHSESLNFGKRLITDMIKYPSAEAVDILPTNTIAVSIALGNFHVGTSCQEFPLYPQFKETTKGYYSYKKLSKCIQVTYFNDEAGNKFMAGACFYPIIYAKPVTCHEDEKSLFWNEIFRTEPFPLANRSKNRNYIQHQQYGRYCSAAGERVLVWTGKSDGQIVHVKYVPMISSNVSKGCSECAKDFKEYKWEEPEKKEQGKEAKLDVPEGFDGLEDIANFNDAISLHSD